VKEYKICKLEFKLDWKSMWIPSQIVNPIIFEKGEKYFFKYYKSESSIVKSVYVFKVENMTYDFRLDEDEVKKYFYTDKEVRKLKLQKLNETKTKMYK
jgi:hypothetical protein